MSGRVRTASPRVALRGTARVGFLPGLAVGGALAVVALAFAAPPGPAGLAARHALMDWLVANLGHSSWLFAAVAGLFALHLTRLQRLLRADQRNPGGADPLAEAVVELDQLTDVWIHVFIGIGVVWTAVGMRSALQVALGDPGAVVDPAGLSASHPADHSASQSASSVLARLVDGGILLALTTTIVGAVGGYLLRLAKTVCVGAALHGFYDRHQQADLRELLITVQRLERTLERRGGDAAH
jgi:hypothetical protein